MVLRGCPGIPMHKDGRMKFTWLLAVPAVFLSSPTWAEPPADPVFCPAAEELSVLASDLQTKLFSAPREERAKIFQGWGENQKIKTENGAEIAYVRVQFPDREDEAQSIGWVPENSLRSREDCVGSRPWISPVHRTLGAGLNDPGCCGFPLGGRPFESYLTAPRSFGANRSGGERKHAACDLYRNRGDKILAVTDGVVIRNLYYFYQGTYAVEVEHAGGFVVRYGEVSGKRATTQGQRLRPGQTVGYMGKTSCCTPMLHFELYAGTKSGPLNSGGPFRRRADLLNPTAYLRKWQANSFRDRK